MDDAVKRRINPVPWGAVENVLLRVIFVVILLNLAFTLYHLTTG